MMYTRAIISTQELYEAFHGQYNLAELVAKLVAELVMVITRSWN
jgi:hypothetical protein